MLCYAVLCYATMCCAMLCSALLHYALQCYAVLCYAVLCYAMLCYAMPCDDMLCYATMLCYAMLCYTMLCYATLRYAMLLCCAMLCYAMLCYAVLCYAMLCCCDSMLCYAILFYATLCYAVLCYAVLCFAMLCYPLEISPPLQCPSPGGGGGITSLFCWAISIAVVCVPHLSHTRSCIALPLLQISHLCVFCDILSPKAVYRVSCPFFRPKMVSPGDRVWYHSRTLGAHVLAIVVGLSPNGPQLCHIRYIRPGGVTQVDHEGAQLSRPQGRRSPGGGDGRLLRGEIWGGGYSAMVWYAMLCYALLYAVLCYAMLRYAM